MLNVNKVLKNVNQIMGENSLFLLDCDNIFRVIKYLRKHSQSPYKFDFIKMELVGNAGHGDEGMRYYTVPELKKMFSENNLLVSSVYGNYNRETLNINSKRIIMVGRKKL